MLECSLMGITGTPTLNSAIGCFVFGQRQKVLLSFQKPCEVGQHYYVHKAGACVNVRLAERRLLLSS